MNKTESSRAFRAKNPNYAKEWRERNRESCRASERKWREANKDKIVARAKERYADNLEANRVDRANRRALALGRTETLTLEQWLVQLEYYDHSCAYCFGPFETLDHVIALAAGGSSDVGNCVPCCQSCNNRKASIHSGKRPFVNQRGGEPWAPHIASDFWPSLPETIYGPYRSDARMKDAA